MRRSLAALLPRAPPLQRWSLAPPLRACSSASGPEERVVRSLADSSGSAVTELDLSGGRGGAHEDLVCVNIMCEHVGGVCICRLSRVLERPSMQSLHTLRLAGNGLSSLPPSVWKLRKLRVLDLRDNKLAALPAEGLQQLQLDALDVRGNPMNAGGRDESGA